MSVWPRVNLRRVARLGTGHTPSRQHPEYWVNCTIPWLTLADVWQLRDGTRSTVYETSEKISERGLANSAAVLHPAGTVVLSRTASVGFSGILGTDMATSQDFVTWTCGSALRPRFLLYAIRGLREEILGMRMGSTHQTIYMPDVERISAPLPPLSVQEVVADFLDAELAHIDALISKKRRMIELARERLRAALAEEFGWRIRCSVDGIPCSVGDNVMVRLGALSTVRSGITLDGGRELDDSAVWRPYLRVANVQEGRLDLTTVKEIPVPSPLARRFELKDGDVLLTEGGDQDKLGRGTVWRGEIPGCLHQNHIFSVRPGRATARTSCPAGSLLPQFLALVTQTHYARAYFEATASKTTGIASTSSSKIASFRVPLLPIAEQRTLVERAESRSRRVASLIGHLEQQISLLQEHRQALTTAAVTGEMEVPGVAS